MAITRDQVDHVAQLSMLNLGDEEKDRFADQLDAILEYVGKLNELETEDIEPLIHVSDRESVFRSDRQVQSLSRKQALENAPESSEGCFKVPSILE